MTDQNEQKQEDLKRLRARTALEDAVYQMIEAGYDADGVRNEVQYAIDSYEF